LEKSVSGNKLGDLAVFLRFSSTAETQSHRLHHLKISNKFRAPDMVGRKPVRFLLQESTGFSIPADSKSGQFKVRTPVKEKPSQLRLPVMGRGGIGRFQSRKESSQNRVISICQFRKSGQFKVRTQESK
jgi:hypothetical protein